MIVIVTIIDGSLWDYCNGEDGGSVSVSEPDMSTSLAMAHRFVDYGKTVVIEPEKDGD